MSEVLFKAKEIEDYLSRGQSPFPAKFIPAQYLFVASLWLVISRDDKGDQCPCGLIYL